MDTEEKNYTKNETSKYKDSQNSDEEEENNNILDSKGFKKREHYSKNDESSSFVNENNNSSDSKLVNNSMKDNRKKFNNKHNLDEELQRIEKRNKENVLCGDDLDELIGEIEKENVNFKKNVFMKNFKNIHNNIGVFDKELIPPLKDDIDKVLNEYHSFDFLIQKYTQRAKNIKEEN